MGNYSTTIATASAQSKVDTDTLMRLNDSSAITVTAIRLAGWPFT